MYIIRGLSLFCVPIAWFMLVYRFVETCDSENKEREKMYARNFLKFLLCLYFMFQVSYDKNIKDPIFDPIDFKLKLKYIVLF